jgi:hypothetical protein
MKTLIALVVGLLAGLAVGWIGGSDYNDMHRPIQAVDAMVQGTEGSDAVAAARSVRAIELIESGRSDKAVRMLSRPIVDYYTEYGLRFDTERRRKTRAMIEELMATNEIVAFEITNAAKNSEPQ